MRIYEELESSTLEFKRELPAPEKFAQEIIAFANTKGGRIVVGYDEKTRTFVDTPALQKQEESIANLVSDYCQPRPVYFVSYETQIHLPDKPTLLVLDVPEGAYKPYSLKNKPLEDGTYIRVGSTSRKVYREELTRLLRAGQNISFDREGIRTTELLDEDALRKFFELRNGAHDIPIELPHRELLQDLNLLSLDGLPTVAGLLLFAKAPQKIPALENAYIKAARFKGQEKGFFIDRQDMYGPLPEQLEAAKSFIVKNTRMSGHISGMQREDRLEYPEHIIRELLVNALVHRDYSISGSCIMVSIYDNRIEVSSPGGLEAGISPNNIEHRQYNRNPVIAKRMFDMGYFDSWGQGIDSIIRWSRESSGKGPIFKDEYDQFTITIFSSLEHTLHGGGVPLPDELGDKEQQVLEYLQTHKTISNREIREHAHTTKGQAQAIIHKLLQSGHIQRRGIGKKTVYTKHI